MRAPRHEEDKEFLATNERELTRIKRRIQKIEERKRDEHQTLNVQHSISNPPMAEIKEIWFNSNKVDRKPRAVSLRLTGVYRIAATGIIINNHKGLAPKKTPTPCRMAPPQCSGHTPALPYPL